MLTVRPAQLDKLGMGVRTRQTAAILATVRRYWPGRCAELGPQALLATINSIVAEAEGFGITHTQDVLRYVNLSFLFGSGYLKDPFFADAAIFLRKPTLAGPVKVDLLMSLAKQMLEGA